MLIIDKYGDRTVEREKEKEKGGVLTRYLGSGRAQAEIGMPGGISGTKRGRIVALGLVWGPRASAPRRVRLRPIAGDI